MAKKYRKKPIVIEAKRFHGKLTMSEAKALATWCGGKLDFDGGTFFVSIPTLEGDMTASKGDYIIKGVQGEFYPCKPDIFEATYEEV